MAMDSSRVNELTATMCDQLLALIADEYTVSEFMSALITLVLRTALVLIRMNPANRAIIKKSLDELRLRLTDTSVN